MGLDLGVSFISRRWHEKRISRSHFWRLALSVLEKLLLVRKKQDKNEISEYDSESAFVIHLSFSFNSIIYTIIHNCFHMPLQSPFHEVILIASFAMFSNTLHYLGIHIFHSFTSLIFLNDLIADPIFESPSFRKR